MVIWHPSQGGKKFFGVHYVKKKKSFFKYLNQNTFSFSFPIPSIIHNTRLDFLYFL